MIDQVTLKLLSSYVEENFVDKKEIIGHVGEVKREVAELKASVDHIRAENEATKKALSKALTPEKPYFPEIEVKADVKKIITRGVVRGHDIHQIIQSVKHYLRHLTIPE